jgi:tetraacyldisaccharide 4'-kinase
VSRGYAARPGEQSDEAAELGVVIPGIRHVADRDRAAGSRTAVAGGADVVVLDDGFQHRRLRRDLDIVAVDATDPFGCGHLFPRGLLREPLRGLTRGHAVVLTRASAVDAATRTAIRRGLEDACGGRLPGGWMEAEHRPVGLRFADGSTSPLAMLHKRRVVAFAGIGNPAAFRSTLASAAADVAEFFPFPDHHAYSAADLERLAARVAATRADFEHCDVALFIGKNPWHSHSIPKARVTLKELSSDPARTFFRTYRACCHLGRVRSTARSRRVRSASSTAKS